MGLFVEEMLRDLRMEIIRSGNNVIGKLGHEGPVLALCGQPGIRCLHFSRPRFKGESSGGAQPMTRRWTGRCYQCGSEH